MPAPSPDRFGHPKGLSVLFAAEMWERFSYFGNAALVVLYMVKYLFEPGHLEAVLGYDAVKGALEFLFGPLQPQPFASQLFGFYTGLAYFAPVAGGWLADRVLGQRRTVIIGGILMAAGHFMMTFESMFFVALTLLILGIGGFKPNISTQVGALYAHDDPRRARAYSIFYVGINIGAFLAPLVCGALAAQFGWHYGFAAAGIGMLISLAIYLYGQRALPPDERQNKTAGPAAQRPLDADEWRSLAALLIVCTFVAFFWAAYDQQFNTMVLWAEDFTDRSFDLGFWRGEIPTPWFLALNPLMIFVCTPLIVRLWTVQSQRDTEPFTITKMAFGCLCVALANGVMALAATVAAGGKASALWLCGYFLLATVGELFLAPVGLALVSLAAPVRLRSMMMGFWFATTLPADILGGYLGGFWSSMAKTDFFLMIGAIAGGAGLALYALGQILSPAVEPKRP